MSLSWTRIIPDPLSGEVNPLGVAYYNKVIDSLLANGITPCVTLYHWDLPLVLEEKVGGWPEEEIIEYFLKYAEVCFKEFGDRVSPLNNGFCLFIWFVLLVHEQKRGTIIFVLSVRPFPVCFFG
jgi:beta-glucosidase/6-phospho-beta-glucosidase/beta-galactosidase